MTRNTGDLNNRSARSREAVFYGNGRDRQACFCGPGSKAAGQGAPGRDQRASMATSRRISVSSNRFAKAGMRPLRPSAMEVITAVRSAP